MSKPCQEYDLRIPTNFAPLPPNCNINAPRVKGVYRIFDKCGRCLYVGQSGDIHIRLHAHRKKKWGAEIARVDFTEIADSQQRLVTEALLILRDRPRHNRMIKLGLRNDGTVYELKWLGGDA